MNHARPSPVTSGQIGLLFRWKRQSTALVSESAAGPDGGWTQRKEGKCLLLTQATQTGVDRFDEVLNPTIQPSNPVFT